MTRKVPHDKIYKIVDNLSEKLNWILIASTLISILVVVLNNFDSSINKKISMISLIILAFLAIVFFIIDIIKNHISHRAELQRKNDFIDNSLKTKLADSNSKGYFTNEEVNSGINKLGVNCFENSFFTKSISSKMLKKQLIYTIVIWFVVLLVILTTPPSPNSIISSQKLRVFNL